MISAVYRTLAARYDPSHDISGIAAVRRAELDRAHAVLTDPARRAAYDADRTRIAFAIADGTAPRPSRGGLAGRIAAHAPIDEGADLRLDFGRYAGLTLSEIIRTDPDYLRWLSRHSSGIRFRGPILRLLAQLEAELRPVASTARDG